MSLPQTHETPAGTGVSQSNEAGGFNANPTPASEATQPPTVDLAAAERFLTLLDDGAETWHFRTFPEAGDGSGWNRSGTFAKWATQLQLDNGNGRGVYVVVNEGGQDAKSITRVRAVYADFDPPKTAPMPASFPIEPHIVVESSPGKRHVYWLVDGLPLEEFKPVQKAIIAKFGSDPSINDLPRVMRLPGFLHQKPADPASGHDGRPFQVRIVEESCARPYTPEEIREAFLTKTGDGAPKSPAAPLHGPSGVVVDTDRHSDALDVTAHQAALVVADGMAPESAFDALRRERDRGRWTREMDDPELRRALEGAIAKYRSGEWELPAFAKRGPREGTPPGELRLVPLAGFMAKPVPEHPHVMESYYPRRVVTLLGGHGGVGKTTLALTHAAHIAAGRPWGPFQVEQGRVVFLSFEDEGADIMRSLQDVVNVCALPPGEIERNFALFDGTDGESELAVESSEGGATRLEFTDMMRKAEEAAAGADIVFIDNASDTFGGNENVRRQVKAFIRALARRIARGNNAAVVLLAHIDKQAARGSGHGNSYSGSTAWHNGARSRLALLESEDGIELLHEKARWGRKADPIALQRAQGGILEPVAAEQAAAAKANAQAVMVRADAKDVLAVIRAAVDADLTIPVARTGQRTTWHALCEMPEMPEALRTKREGKPRVEAAITALERQGAIVQEEYRNPSRRVAVRWTLAQEQAAEAA